MSFFKSSPEKLKKLEKLGNIIQNIDKPKPSTVFRNKNKERLMAIIQYKKPSSLFSKTINILLTASQEIIPNPNFRVKLKEKLRSYSKQIDFFPSLETIFIKHKVILSSIVLGTFTIATFFSFTAFTPEAKALSKAIIHPNQGIISITRDGRTFQINQDLVLNEQDLIFVPKSSLATIYFPDESITRITENSSLKIDKVFINPQNPSESFIQINLEEGQIWTKVLNLSNKMSEFNVALPSSLTTVKNKATFSSKAKKNKESITSIDNSIKIKTGINGKSKETILTKGLKAEILTSKVASIKKINLNKEWIKNNIKNDKEYIKKLNQKKAEEISKKAGILPGEAMYKSKTLKEQATLALSFNPFTSAKNKITIAETKLFEASTLLIKNEKEAAKNSLNLYQKLILEVSNESKNLKKENKEKIKALLKISFEKNKKTLNTFPTESFLDQGIIKIQETKILIAEGKKEKIIALLESSEDAISNATTLIEKGEELKAEEKVKEYQKTLNNISHEMTLLKKEEKEEIIHKITITNLENLKNIKNINQEIIPTILKTESLKIEALILENNQKKNIELLTKLKEKNKEEIKSFERINTNEILIITQNATPDVEIIPTTKNSDTINKYQEKALPPILNLFYER